MVAPESQRNYHIGPTDVVVRDLELFHKKLGIGVYNDQVRQRYETTPGAVSLAERNVWLPAETQEIAGKVADGKSVLIEGELGAGKSALVYGLRALYRDTGQPYLYHDGHFVVIPTDRLHHKVTKARKKDSVVIFDSMDYLIGLTTKVRKIPLEKHRERSRHIMWDLMDHIDLGGTLVATSHTQPWLRTYCDPYFLDGMWKELTGKMEVHNVRGVFEHTEELIQFYIKAGFSEAEATRVASLATDPTFQNFLQETYPDTRDEILMTLQKYRIAKLISVDPREQSQGVRSSIRMSTDNSQYIPLMYQQVARFVVDKNIETKEKMGLLQNGKGTSINK